MDTPILEQQTTETIVRSNEEHRRLYAIPPVSLKANELRYVVLIHDMLHNALLGDKRKEDLQRDIHATLAVLKSTIRSHSEEVNSLRETTVRVSEEHAPQFEVD